MKKFATFTALVIGLCFALTGCKDKRKPGWVYMPDMAYSRAYETYAERDPNVFTTNPAMRGSHIYYDNIPVNGTLKRGDLAPFPFEAPNGDKMHDSLQYEGSSNFPNPFTTLDTAALQEAGRLFNINCAICHGSEGKGNGPVQAKFGYVANLTEPKYWQSSDSSKAGMKDGKMYYSITYGKNTMGSYASQLSREDRWKVIKYIRTLQEAAGAGAKKAEPAQAAQDKKPEVPMTAGAKPKNP